eukprot:GHVN01047012.1.p1 GENE.GHVN01047012.1~~GHVN01047012.1.p1  ORF type:complete len:328 (+),score=52.15 GHVN01047012.1:25-984(+)
MPKTQAHSSKPSIPLRCFDLQPPYAAVRVRVHPVVMLTVFDGLSRRSADGEIIIGTLLGTMTEGNVVDVSDCFIDRHKFGQDGTFQIIRDHHESMYDLKHKVNVKEQVIGWFCTGSHMTGLAWAVNKWFRVAPNTSRFVPQPPLTDPVLLLVDTEVKPISQMMRVFIQLQTKTLNEDMAIFYQIPVELVTTEAERSGIAMATKLRKPIVDAVGYGRAPPDATFPDTSTAPDGFESALQRLLDLLIKCKEYVDDAVSGVGPADPAIGRSLAKAICAEAMMDGDSFTSVCQSASQDQIMAAYLTSLAKLQLVISEKLTTAV